MQKINVREFQEQIVRPLTKTGFPQSYCEGVDTFATYFRSVNVIHLAYRGKARLDPEPLLHRLSTFYG
jgi:hypothetical protein